MPVKASDVAGIQNQTFPFRTLFNMHITGTFTAPFLSFLFVFTESILENLDLLKHQLTLQEVETNISLQFSFVFTPG